MSSVRHLKLAGTWAVPLAAATVAGTVFAQESSHERQLDEIVVTAQRRSENLSEVPVAVTALDADALNKQAIVSERDLQTAAPGLLVRATWNSDQLNYSIRGQTVDAFTSSQPGVLPYFNEFQVSTSYSASSFYDLASIQVLKGPQGTLFGRNATGGAVLITSAPPADDFGGYITARAGNLGLRGGEGALNVPLVEDVALLRIASKATDKDGFLDNEYTGTDNLGEREERAGRISLLLKPVDGFTNTTVFDYTKIDGSSTPLTAYSAYAVGSDNNGVPLSTTASLLFGPGQDLLFGPGAWDAYVAAHPGVDPNGLVSFVEAQRARGPHADVSLDVDPSIDSKAWMLVNTTTFEINDFLQLKNIAGYSHSRSRSVSDIDGTPFGLESLAPGTGTLLDTDAYSEELQLSGTGLGGQLEYIGGVYYFHSKARDNSTAIFFDLPGIRQDVDIDSERKDEMVAGYAQGTYDLSSLTGLQGLGFTIGMRYTSEKVTLEQLPGSQLRDLPIPGAENTRSEKFNRLSWTVGLQEQLNDNVLIYGVSRSSFRSGGFNTFAAPLPGTAEDGGSGFDMEKVIDFELGVKFAGHLGGAPSRLNIALFHQKVDAVQRSIYVDPDGPGPLTVAGFTANIPEAKIKGVEVDGVVSPTVWLDLGMSLAYNDAEFSKDTAVLFGQSKTYGPYPDTPEFTGSVYVSTTTSLPNNWGELNLRGDMFHQSHFYFGSLDNFTVPGTKLPHYTLANFRAGVDDILGSAVSVTAHVKNAFDKKYYVGGIPVGEVLSVNAAVPGEPRTYFVELGYKF